MLMPEYKAATAQFTDPPRVRSGEFAQQLFTFYATHNAGIFQKVYNVVPGQLYCLSVWGHAWSSYDDGAYTDMNNHGYLNQSIGIDPTGGTSFKSGDIVWTPAVTQYDEYGLFKLEVEAQSDTLTVFFNSNPLWAAKHNDVYWDDATLVQVGEREPAEMEVSPLWVNIEAESGKAVDVTESIDVSIKNDWQNNLSWSAQLLPDAPFDVALRPEGEQLHLDISTDGLAAGQHKATVQINASDFSILNAQKYVTVQIDVAQSDPEIVLDKSKISHLIGNESTAAFTETIEIDLLNIEGLTNVEWQAQIDATSDFTPTLVNHSGQHGEMLEINIDPTGLENGAHYAYMQVTASSDAGGFSQPQRLTLVLIIADEVSHILLPTILR